MTGFLLRRAANWLVLVVLATSMAYLLAAGALDPRANYENRRPRPPPAVVDARLDELNLNDETPLIERYVTWAGTCCTATSARPGTARTSARRSGAGSPSACGCC